MKKILFLLLFSGMALAQSHFHGWQKQNETIGQDAYGNQVKICSWICRTDFNNTHYATTQGSGYCPMPY